MKCELTSANAAANTVWISRSTALITRIRSRRVLRTSSSCVFEERCRSCSSLNSSKRQRVDRAHQPQLALQVPHPGRRADALGQRRPLGGLGGRRLEVVVAAQCLDRPLQAHPHLGLVDLDPT